MFSATLQIGSTTLSTYTTLVALALFISAGFALYRTVPDQRLSVLDVLIGGLIAGVILARIEHVLLNWNYFAYNTAEIPQVYQGGLDWHGAVIGAGIGMGLIARWRKIALTPVLDSLTLLIPLLSLAVWWGCWGVSCRYGMEVTTLADYPSWMVWEGRDIFGIYAPRFHTQLIGMLSSGALLAVTLVLFWRKWLVYRRFWLLMTGVACIIFFISFLQGDYSIQVYQLRLTQYFDGIFILFTLIVGLRIKIYN
jgi:prolipoprotein diacylglyceryltransferase